MEENAIGKKEIIRWGFAVLFIILALAMMIYTVESYLNLSIREGLIDIPYNELTKAGIDSKLKISETLFQLGLLMLAALWGLIIAKKDEAGIVFSINPELLTFICASLLLLFSLFSYTLYLKAIAGGFADSGLAFEETEKTIINLFDPKFDYLFNCQFYNLIAGVVVAIFTLFSANKLKT